MSTSAETQPTVETTQIEPKDLYLINPDDGSLKERATIRTIFVIVLTGFLAFALVGFFGYPTDPPFLNVVFHPAWALFLWFAALILMVEWKVFRHEGAAAWRWQSTIATLVCVAVVGVAYEQPQALSDFLSALVQSLNGLGIAVNQERVLWNLGNFAPLVIYLVDRLILWVPGNRTEHQRMLAHMPADSNEPQLTPYELLSQDMFAGAVLSFLLAVILQTSVLNLLVHPAARIGTCDLSWLIGNCPGVPRDPPTLTNVDVAIGLFALGVSLIFLAVVVVARVAFLPDEQGLAAILRAIEATVLAVLNPLDVLIRLRAVLWPLLTLAGVIGAATVARYTRLYLHLLSDKQTCAGTITCPDLREFASSLSNSLNTAHFQAISVQLEVSFLAVALIGGVGGTFAILMAMRMHVAQVFPWRFKTHLSRNWLTYLWRLASNVARVFWLPSLALSISMTFVQHVNLTTRAPFPQPGITTVLSVLFLCLTGPLISFRQWRKRTRDSDHSTA